MCDILLQKWDDLKLRPQKKKIKTKQNQPVLWAEGPTKYGRAVVFFYIFLFISGSKNYPKNTKILKKSDFFAENFWENILT